MERLNQVDLGRALGQTRQPPRGDQEVADLDVIAIPQSDLSVLEDEDTVRGGHGHRPAIPGCQAIQRLLVGMPNYCLEGLDPRLFRVLIETGHPIPQVVTPALEAI